MLGNTETELARLRIPAKVQAMEQPGDGDAQCSPGYDGTPAAPRRFVERRRNRRQPWERDAILLQPKGDLAQLLCQLIPDHPPQEHRRLSPFAIAEQSRFGAHGGVRSHSAQRQTTPRQAIAARVR